MPRAAHNRTTAAPPLFEGKHMISLSTVRSDDTDTVRFTDAADLRRALAEQDYIADDDLATVRRLLPEVMGG